MAPVLEIGLKRSDDQRKRGPEIVADVREEPEFHLVQLMLPVRFLPDLRQGGFLSQMVAVIVDAQGNGSHRQQRIEQVGPPRPVPGSLDVDAESYRCSGDAPVRIAVANLHGIVARNQPVQVDDVPPHGPPAFVPAAEAVQEPGLERGSIILHGDNQRNIVPVVGKRDPLRGSQVSRPEILPVHTDRGYRESRGGRQGRPRRELGRTDQPETGRPAEQKGSVREFYRRPSVVETFHGFLAAEPVQGRMERVLLLGRGEIDDYLDKVFLRRHPDIPVRIFHDTLDHLPFQLGKGQDRVPFRIVDFQGTVHHAARQPEKVPAVLHGPIETFVPEDLASGPGSLHPRSGPCTGPNGGNAVGRGRIDVPAQFHQAIYPDEFPHVHRNRFTGQVSGNPVNALSLRSDPDISG